jgi:glyoxylase-like metal-dependent hydrolase (beta-lactamase superfamily II)
MMGENSFMIEADDYLKDGGKLAFAGFDIQAVSTPGHTQGGMCYLVKCGTEKALFSGDTLFEGSVGRYDFPTSSGTALFANIKNKLLKLEDNLMVYPGHGQATTIGDERPNF